MQVRSFLEHCMCGDADEVKIALADDRSLVNARDEYLGSTPLILATHRGFTEIVHAVLAAGAEVEARERVSGTTALHWAAEGGHVELARELISRGADIEARDDWFGLTPLGWGTVVNWNPSFHKDRPGTVAALLAAGASIDPFVASVTSNHDRLRGLAATDSRVLEGRLAFVGEGHQPLHIAIQPKVPSETVALLLQLGAPVDALTDSGMSPLTLARIAQRADVALLLQARGAVDDLSLFVIRDDGERIAQELTLEPFGDDSDRRRRLLFIAAEHGLSKAAAALCAAGADPNAGKLGLLGERPGELTPLHLAAKRGHAPCITALVAAGASTNPALSGGDPSPLHLAAGGGHLAAVRALVEAGARLDVRESGFGSTPQGWAEHDGNGEIVQFLVERGGQGRERD